MRQRDSLPAATAARFPVRRPLMLAAMLALLAGCAGAQGTAQDTGASCRTPGGWVSPATARPLAPQAVLRAAARRRIVLLGEVHANMEHHRWQAYMLAALHALHPDLVVGFEMFPRAAQPVLDDWSQGKLDEKTFLEKSNWNRVWGFDPALYRPLLHFVRQHRLKAVALNVGRALVSRVGREGWQAVPAGDRQGIGDPAPASDAYRRSLAEVYGAGPHGGSSPDPSDEKKPDEKAVQKTLNDPAFGRFVAAQQTWDRAMAEALARAARRDPDALVVGIVGGGHIRNRHGIPHQLADLGIRDVSVLLAAEPDEACGDADPTLADAVFVVAPPETAEPAPAKPRLGVMIGDGDDGVRVNRVLAGTVAETAGLKAGDVILSAAGFRVKKAAELVEVVARQAPGTWLPLRIRRGGAESDLVAKFPQRFGERK